MGRMAYVQLGVDVGGRGTQAEVVHKAGQRSHVHMVHQALGGLKALIKPF